MSTNMIDICRWECYCNPRDRIDINNFILLNLLFRVAEVQRTCETTATPITEGACLSEYNPRRDFEQ